MEETKKAAQRKQEDASLNRVLIWFGGAVVAEALMLLVRRFYLNYTVKEIMLAYHLEKVIHTLIYVGAAGFAVSLVWAIVAAKLHKSAALPHALTVIFALTGVFSKVTWQYRDGGVNLICVLIPVATILALVYYLYQRECFLSIVLSSAGVLGLWIYRRANGGHTAVVYGYLAVLAAVLVAAVLLTLVMQKKHGSVVWRGKPVAVFSRNAAYVPVYVTAGIVAVALAAGVAAGMAVAYYLMLGLVAWIFVLAVYFTVRLM